MTPAARGGGARCTAGGARWALRRRALLAVLGHDLVLWIRRQGRCARRA